MLDLIIVNHYLSKNAESTGENSIFTEPSVLQNVMYALKSRNSQFLYDVRVMGYTVIHLYLRFKVGSCYAPGT